MSKAVLEMLTSAARGLFGFVVFTGAFITIPTDRPFDPKGAIDWVGAYLGVGALFLFNFAWK